MRKGKVLARPIKSRRDYEGAATAAEGLRSEAEPDSAAERRLKALIREMEAFDDLDEDVADDGDPTGEIYGGPLRRWSDDASDSD